MASSSRRLLSLCLVLLACRVATVLAQSNSKDSPFLAANTGVTAPASNERGTHELVGMIASSKQTVVGLTNKATRKSIWIPVGSAADGVEVVSCDPKTDTALVRIQGELQTLSMRSSTPVSIAPVAASTTPVVPSPSAAPRPAAQLEQEREARMLVSDLLEIGMQQRKAYEDAQKKASEKKSAPSGTASATSPK